MILALDIATTTGYALGEAGSKPSYGHFRSGKRAGSPGEIAALFRDWLNELCKTHQPQWLVYESPYIPRQPQPFARRQPPPVDIYVLRRLITLCGIAEEVAWRHQIACREEASNVVCKQFTGRGSWGSRAEKKVATQKMCAVYGWHQVTEDEADALALWTYAETVLYPALAMRRGAGSLFAVAAE